MRILKLMDDPALNALNTTNYRIVVGVRIASIAMAVIGAVWVVEVLRGHHDMADHILDAALLFLAALSGISAAQYGAKRFSDKGLAEVKASRAPTNVVTSQGGPVTAEMPAVSLPPAKLAEDTHPTTPTLLVPPSEEHEWSTGDDPRAGIL